MTPTPITGISAEVKEIPVDLLAPAPWNPRSSAEPAALAELTDSIRTRGVLVPLLVRAIAPGRYHIIAGHRRHAGAKAAELVTVPCIVRDVDDAAAQAEAIVENLQRENLSALDEAKSFRALMDLKGDVQTAASIAKRVGKTERYVWERIRLLDLIPDAQRLLQAGMLPLPHAIILSTLTAADQKRALETDATANHAAVFKTDNGFEFDDRKKTPGKWEGVKPVSVRELQQWVRDHVRFDPAHAALAAPLDFGPAAARVQEAEAQPGRRKKLASITFDSYVQPDAKNGLGTERIYTVVSWKRADGQEKSKPCEDSVLGVVVVGPRYGETFSVCVKKGCPVHWPEDKKAKAKQAGRDTTTHAGNSQSSWEREEAKRKLNSQAWATVYPRAREAIIQATAKVTTSDKHLVEALDANAETLKVITNAVGAITYRTFGRAWVLRQALDDIQENYYNEYSVPRALAAVKAKFDLKAEMKAAIKALETPATEKAAPADPAKAKPAATKKAAPKKAKAA